MSRNELNGPTWALISTSLRQPGITWRNRSNWDKQNPHAKFSKMFGTTCLPNTLKNRASALWEHPQLFFSCLKVCVHCMVTRQANQVWKWDRSTEKQREGEGVKKVTDVETWVQSHWQLRRASLLRRGGGGVQFKQLVPKDLTELICVCVCLSVFMFLCVYVCLANHSGGLWTGGLLAVWGCLMPCSPSTR